jgi:chromosome partitioning protein
VSTLKQHFAERCLPPVRAAIKVKEAPAQGQTIFEYAEDSNAAEDYAEVVKLIMGSRERTAGSSPEEAHARSAPTTTATTNTPTKPAGEPRAAIA